MGQLIFARFSPIMGSMLVNFLYRDRCMSRGSVTAVLLVLATYALSAAAGIDDIDNDGVTDETDNCVLVANPLQRDTDADDIGNFCDPDLNNDGLVTSADRTILNGVFFTSDPDSDFNADGNVNFLDLAILQSYFGQAPGPPGTVIWAVAANGSWHEKSNWLPQVVPTAGVTAIVDVAGNIVVSVDGDTVSVKTLILEEDLELTDATFSASNQVEASGTISMTGSVINNTTIVPSQAGSGLLATGAGSTNQWNGVTLGIDGLIVNGDLVEVAGGLTVNATVTIVGPSSPTGLHFTQTQTLNGSGSVIFNGIGNGVITEPRLFPVNGTTLTIGPNLTISGGTGTIGQTFASLVLDGNVTADASSETLVISGAPWSATGTLTAENGATIQLSGELDNGTNAVDLDAAAGTVTLLNGAGLANATLNGTPGTVITLNSGSYDIEAVQLDVDMNMNNGAIANVSGGLTLNGSLAINAPTSPTGLHFTQTQTFNGSGSVIFNGIGNGVISEPRLLPLAGTTLTIGPNLSISGGIGTLGNFSAALILNGTVSASTANLRVLGSTVTNGGLLEAINGNDLTADNLSGDPGTLHAGADSTVILLDALSLSAGSHVLIDIGGPALVGRISATSGAAVYAGTATISAVDGFMPSVSDSFVILNHTGFSGSFDTVNSVGLGAGESFSISFDAAEGEATVSN